MDPVQCTASKSGLNIANRAGIKRLLRDVMDEPRPFDIVLVCDVSRWGRFQSIDASAYYEYTCRLHGVDVIYVEEVFGNVRDPMTALLKTMKRAMAAEYAREMGVKTRAGQDRAISLGYQIGPMPCIGFRRVAVERNGQRRPLARGQYKSMQNERIAWEPGPETETDLVRHIFELYASEGERSRKVNELDVVRRSDQRPRAHLPPSGSRQINHLRFLADISYTSECCVDDIRVQM
jgi:DNA invertase Pin-like site-specific DNA recombinase